MEYISFCSHSKGYYHVRAGTDCEDYSASYIDEQGRYAIAVICDGHSDKNCFRSGTGARLGCDTMLEIGYRFFELYFEDESIDFKQLSDPERLKRLKYSIKCCWDDKVMQDIAQNPLTEEEMAPLTERVYKYYKSGKGLNNIYGATFLAVAICNDFFLALHIGDGEILCISPNGEYYDPLPNDEKSESGSPASLCDNDLFSRDNAFRCIITQELPVAATVSSDGVPDCLDQLQYKEIISSLLTKLKDKDVDGTWNSNQSEYLNAYTAHWAKEGVGVEDDCSIAGFYKLNTQIPPVIIPYEEASQMILRVVEERNSMIIDYENRKNKLAAEVVQQSKLVDSLHHDIRRYPTELKRFEEMLTILHNMEVNEREKCTYYDQKLKTLEVYIKRVNGKVPTINLVKMREIEPSILQTCSISTIKSSPSELQNNLRELINKHNQTISDYEKKKQELILQIDALFRKQSEFKTNRAVIYHCWCDIRNFQLQLAEITKSENEEALIFEQKAKPLIKQLKAEGIIPEMPVIAIQKLDSKYIPDAEDDWEEFKKEMGQDILETDECDDTKNDQCNKSDLAEDNSDQAVQKIENEEDCSTSESSDLLINGAEPHSTSHDGCINQSHITSTDTNSVETEDHEEAITMLQESSESKCDAMPEDANAVIEDGNADAKATDNNSMPNTQATNPCANDACEQVDVAADETSTEENDNLPSIDQEIEIISDPDVSPEKKKRLIGKIFDKLKGNS